MILIDNKKYDIVSSVLKRVKLDVINIYQSNWNIYEIQNIGTHNLITSRLTLDRLNNEINRE
jgi:hypothetical protein